VRSDDVVVERPGVRKGSFTGPERTPIAATSVRFATCEVASQAALCRALRLGDV